ncbi:MAG: AAA family ATPase [Planctomycetaceae bacterium]
MNRPTDATTAAWHPFILEYCRTLGVVCDAVDRLYQRIVSGDITDKRAVETVVASDSPAPKPSADSSLHRTATSHRLPRLPRSNAGSKPSPPQPSSTPSSATKRRILATGTIVKCLDRGNHGNVVRDDGGATIAVEHVGEDGTKTVDHPVGEMTLQDGTPIDPTAIVPLPMLSVRELVGTHHKLRSPIIHGLLREGETMNIIAASKIGKSWLATLLALDFATQRKWLGRFDTAGGDVLIVDNELHAETSAYRIPAVATANMTHLDEYADHIQVTNLRGELIDLPELAVRMSLIPPGRFKLIILDAFYRFLPIGCDENSNPDMTAQYNSLDSIAGKLQCAIVCIHHSSKGNQASKTVTDVGSGAGSMSRAADCHVVLRPHEQPNVVVMEAAARSWPPLEPLCLRWEFPIFSEVTTLDPTLLRPERSREKGRSSRLAADIERFRYVQKHQGKIVWARLGSQTR